ncbi:MAG: hypothetical protein K2P78_07875 [Gemmataceae bacterium]|nr:hypothetical protein [Gemmataceae bacterium]
MKTRLLGATLGLALCLSLFLDRDASARVAKTPGTVTWANGYPKMTNSTPNSSGYVSVSGTYTVNAGWTLVSALFFYQPQGGGTISSVGLDFNNGQWGQLANGQIVPKNINLSPGNYTVWVIFGYQDTMVPPDSVAVGGVVYNITIT